MFETPTPCERLFAKPQVNRSPLMWAPSSKCTSVRGVRQTLEVTLSSLSGVDWWAAVCKAACPQVPLASCRVTAWKPPQMAVRICGCVCGVGSGAECVTFAKKKKTSYKLLVEVMFRIQVRTAQLTTPTEASAVHTSGRWLPGESLRGSRHRLW